MTISAESATAAAVGGPLSLADLAALLRAAEIVCRDLGGEAHDLRSAVYTVRDRVTLGTGFPELGAAGLEDDVVFSGARIQAAGSLARAVFGMVQADPVVAVLRWERNLGSTHREMLQQMLHTAYVQVSIEEANSRAAAMLGVEVAALGIAAGT